MQATEDRITANRSEWDGMVKAVRIAIEEGCIRRFFVTASASDGIDKLTFATDISHHPSFAGLFGFSAAELRNLVRQAIDTEAYRTTTDAVFRQMAEIYKRFKFSTETQDWIFPPTVSLYYLSTWQRTQRKPLMLFEAMNGIDYKYVLETKLKEQFIL